MTYQGSQIENGLQRGKGDEIRHKRKHQIRQNECEETMYSQKNSFENIERVDGKCKETSDLFKLDQ